MIDFFIPLLYAGITDKPTRLYPYTEGAKMSFKKTVKVPLVTSAMKNAIEQIAPGISTVTSIPVIESQETALKFAEEIAKKQLVKYEYISRLESVEDTAEGWTVVFHCAGD